MVHDISYLRLKLARAANVCYYAVILSQVLIWTYVCVDFSGTNPNFEQTVDLEIRGGGQWPQTEPTADQLARPLMVDARAQSQTTATNEHKKASSQRQAEDWNKYFSPLLGHTILPRNPWIVLNGSYIENPSRICTQHLDLDLVVVVHTAPYNFIKRRMLRESFSPPRLPRPYTAQVVFMLGTFNSTTVDPAKELNLTAEIRKYNDIVRMDFQEHFRNLTYKAMLWLRWLDEHCPNALMVLKLDDDVVMDVKKVLPLSRGLFSKYKRSIFCSTNPKGTQPIPRIGRTCVDPREFTGVKIYPYTYCSGFIVFLSRDLISPMAKAVRRTPMYNVDDVFMFGMVAKMAGNVTYHNIGYNITLWHDKVYNCTVSDGLGCRYYGTMAKKDNHAIRMYDAFDRIHRYDFKIPTLKVV
ncbi:hexosyltransferase [Elysia marginata]|uniref:Hexosyltransferase n=1 Tax=Elysia marginata TaxID=1093978 RepID=A0AAV4HKY9_9GAST|nr:hexosyltransferase [Elysia marginata]